MRIIVDWRSVIRCVVLACALTLLALGMSKTERPYLVSGVLLFVFVFPMLRDYFCLRFSKAPSPRRYRIAAG